MKAEILELLREKDTYISGQELCERFQVSRTAVWKAVNALKEQGYQIEAVPNKGYHLTGQEDVLSTEELKSRIHTELIGRDVCYLPTTASTNLDVKNRMENGGCEGVLVVAGEQTKGRGRRGREWASPADGNIYMSLGLKPNIQPDLAPMMTLIEALSVARAVKSCCDLECQIKWPNDVVIGGKKICGILTEMSAETGYIHYVVIGTGINVNETEFSEEIRETATSLRLETGNIVLRAPLIAKKCEFFEGYYKDFLKYGDLRGLMEDYNAHMVNCGRSVRVLDPKGAFDGIADGIDERGRLMVKKEDGETVAVYAGEVSVRGVYGYV